MSVAAVVAPAAAQSVRVSVATGGGQANGASSAAIISGNGRYVAFSSLATNLVAGDTNGTQDVFVHDLTGNTTSRVSVASDTTQGSSHSYVGGISDDGNIVVFSSYSAFVPADTPVCQDQYGVAASCVDVYVHDRSTGQTALVSVASNGTLGNNNSWNPRISGDGRYVVFQSDATNLVDNDTNTVTDVFLHDRVTHVTTRLSQRPDGQQGIKASTFPTISRDGLSVAFISAAGSLGDGTSVAGQRAFVKTLLTGELRRLESQVPPPANPSSGSSNALLVELNANARYAAIKVEYGDTQNRNFAVELHDLNTSLITSTGTPGDVPDGIAVSDDGRYFAAGGQQQFAIGQHSLWVSDRINGLKETLSIADAALAGGPSFSSDGRRLAYVSNDAALVTGDTNAVDDVFVYDRDADGDGMPNVWETRYGLNPADAADASADPDGDSLTNLQEFQANSLPTGAQARYFAEGASNSFFTTRIAVVNPNATAATVLLHLFGANGQQTTETRTLTANSRTTFELGSSANLPDTTFSSIVESDQPVVADRLMMWDATGYGSHLETSIDAPGTTWYLAEGATGGSYSLYYLLQNPGATEAVATVTYLRPSPQAPIVKNYNVAAHSRFTIDVTGEDPGLASAEVSAKITSTQPIVVERAMYLSRPGQLLAAGHDGAGIAAPAMRWFLAEGATGFFDEYVLIANAEANPANITVTYLLEGAASFTESFPVPGNSRYTLDLKRNAQLASTPVSVIVESTNTVPVVVERVMWWPTGSSNWYEASLSAGVTGTGTKWAIAEGEQDGPFHAQTYVLIANTDPTTDGSATVTLMYEGGTSSSQTVSLPKNSRTTVDISRIAAAHNQRFGVVVESNGVPIVVERSLYNNTAGAVQWPAGATSVATNITAPPTPPTP